MTRILKNPEATMSTATEMKTKLKAFARGEMTWAEVEGMTFEEARAIAQVGCDLAGAGRLEEAKIIFEGLVAGNPYDSASQAALGTVYQRLGRIEDAVTAYSKSIERDPTNPVALAYRGEIRVRRGDRTGFTDLSKAVAADPNGQTPAGQRARAVLKAITVFALDAKLVRANP